jgi:AbrB family looped-hinge helix DNA binding protein
MSTTTLTKWGNSQGVIIPKSICNHLGLKPGDKVSVTLIDDRISIEPEREFTLTALMQNYDGPMPEAYDWGEPRGKELW